MIRLDSESEDKFFELHIDDSGNGVLFIVDKFSRTILQEISVGKFHPVELFNRGPDMMILGRDILKKERESE